MRLYHRIRQNRERLLAAASRHGARNVRLFGSVAREQNSDQSDVDVLVELDPNRTLLDHVALQQEFTEILGCRVDVVVEGGISPYLEARIMAEAIPL